MAAEIESGFWGRILYGVTAPFYLAKLFQPYFSGGAAVVNISSSRDRMSQPQTESYTVAKGGISALTHALAVSLAGRVRVNSISPGWIDTDFIEYTGADAVQHLPQLWYLTNAMTGQKRFVQIIANVIEEDDKIYWEGRYV